MTRRPCSGVIATHTSTPKKIRSAKIRWGISRVWFFGSTRHPPHWLTHKGPPYQRGVLIICGGANAGHSEGETSREVHHDCLVLALQCSCSPATYNPEQTGLPTLQISWSTTLFSGSDTIGLPPAPWTEKAIDSSPFFVWSGGHCCRADLVGPTIYWFFVSGLQKLEQWGRSLLSFMGNMLRKYRVWSL